MRRLIFTRIDHVSLAVKNIDQAMMFYRTLFGNEVMKDNKTDRRFLRVGPCYLSIAPAAAGQAIRIDQRRDGGGAEDCGRERRHYG